MSFLKTVGQAAFYFITTDIDNFCLLIIFFSICNRPLNVVIGQTIGFTIVVALSLLGLVFGNFLPPDYISLLGFVPLLKGLYMLTQNNSSLSDEDENNIRRIESSNDDLEWQEPLSYQQERNSFEESSSSDIENSSSNYGEICNFIIMTVSSGGDNISIYFPVFAYSSTGEIIIIILVFYVFVMLWLFLAYHIVDNGYQNFRTIIEEHSNRIIPFILIGIGIYILSSSILSTFIMHEINILTT
jgi:cadmium resistance protein CadD (predicted permease)